LDLSSVENITLAGGASNQILIDNLSKTFNRARVKNNYGSTEAGPGLFGPHPSLPTPPASVGCEKPDMSYRLVDGVLQIKSPYMMQGYDQGNRDFTQDGYYVTNDIFQKDHDGFYYFVGRNDDMFKSGGHKIFPAEIEQVLENHPWVNQCVVVPVPDPIKQFKPYAFVTVNSLSITTVDQLKDFLKNKLANYQIPREIWVIDKMPLSSVNKIDRHQLKCLAQTKLTI
jgi:long-chain acyl-CoA synthetase